MANNIRIEVTGLREMVECFEDLSKPFTHRELSSFEVRFQAAYRAVRGATHVDTGRLRLSGRADTHYDGDEWSGEMSFLAHPGVFELARGNAPSAQHPEGGHFFFNAVEPFLPGFEDDIDNAIRMAFKERPI